MAWEDARQLSVCRSQRSLEHLGKKASRIQADREATRTGEGWLGDFFQRPLSEYAAPGNAHPQH